MSESTSNNDNTKTTGKTRPGTAIQEPFHTGDGSGQKKPATTSLDVSEQTKGRDQETKLSSREINVGRKRPTEDPGKQGRPMTDRYLRPSSCKKRSTFFPRTIQQQKNVTDLTLEGTEQPIGYHPNISGMVTYAKDLYDTLRFSHLLSFHALRCGRMTAVDSDKPNARVTMHLLLRIPTDFYHPDERSRIGSIIVLSVQFRPITYASFDFSKPTPYKCTVYLQEPSIGSDRSRYKPYPVENDEELYNVYEYVISKAGVREEAFVKAPLFSRMIFYYSLSNIPNEVMFTKDLPNFRDETIETILKNYALYPTLPSPALPDSQKNYTSYVAYPNPSMLSTRNTIHRPHPQPSEFSGLHTAPNTSSSSMSFASYHQTSSGSSSSSEFANIEKSVRTDPDARNPEHATRENIGTSRKRTVSSRQPAGTNVIEIDSGREMQTDIHSGPKNPTKKRKKTAQESGQELLDIDLTQNHPGSSSSKQ